MATVTETINVDRGDVALSVRVRPAQPGQPTVLYLHGLAGHGAEWSGVGHFLPDGFGAVAPDQRGHGASFKGGTTDVAPDRWVGDAVACIEAQSDGPVIVVGQSMGTLVAVRLAAAHPELVSHLVLIEGGMAAMTADGLAGLKAWFDSWPTAFATRREATEFFGVDERSTKAWVDGLVKVDGGFGPRFDPPTMLDTMRHLASDDLWGVWEDLAAPTILMRATSSAIGDDDIARMQEMRPDVELVTIAGGHDLHLDEPEIVAGVIERFASQ